MKQKSQITTFYIETLILVAVMIGILLVLTQIVGISRRESTQAKRLTEAVTIAQSAAEAAAAGEELSELEELLSLGEFTVTEAAGEETAEGIYRWQRENGRYIPNPASWLNRNGWEDELPPGDVQRHGAPLSPLAQAAVRRMMAGEM